MRLAVLAVGASVALGAAAAEAAAPEAVLET